MSLLGKLVISIVGDTAGLERSLNSAEKSMVNISKKWQQVGKKMTGVGLGMTAGITLPLALVGKKALDMAMDAVESENLFAESMEGMADEATKWSKELRKELGLNEYEVRKNAATFNVMFDSMGIGTEASYDMATGITELAYDMASFYNLPTEEAFAKLQAGITGEAEPLKRLGILVSENTIKQWAYNNALVAPGEALTEQEKVHARYGVIMEQTQKAQGDLARTIESPTNQLRLFKEQVNMLLIDVGTQLIPIFSDVLSAVTPIVEGFANASEGTKKFWVTLGLVVAIAGPVVIVLGRITTAVGVLGTKIIWLRSTAILGGLGAKLAGIGTVAVTVAQPLGILALLLESNERAMANIPGLAEKVNSEYSTMQKVLSTTPFGLTNSYHDLVSEGLQPAIHELTLMDDKMPGVIGHAEDLAQSYLDGKISLEELVGLLENYAGSMGDLIEKNPELAARILATEQAERELATATEEATIASEEQTEALLEEADAAEEAKKTIDELIESIFKYYNLNQTATEATWKYEEALAAAAETAKDVEATDKDKQKAMFDVQDALEGLVLSMAKEYESTETSIARKKELQEQFDEVGRKAIENGQLSGDAFDEMARRFTEDKDAISEEVEGLDKELEEMTEPRTVEVGFLEDIAARQGIEKNISGIPTDITVNVHYASGDVPGLAEGGILQQGGIVDVGERGRERIYLPQGAVVKPLEYGGGDISGDININVSGDTEGLDTELMSEIISDRLIEVIKQEGARN